MDAEAEAQARVRALVKELRDAQDLSYKELAARLAKLGLHIDDRVLNNINRGAFTAGFLVLLLQALNVLAGGHQGTGTAPSHLPVGKAPPGPVFCWGTRVRHWTGLPKPREGAGQRTGGVQVLTSVLVDRRSRPRLGFPGWSWGG